MAKINCFEELDAWKAGRRLSREIYELTRKVAFSKDYALKDQIRRAAVSVMANIAEGFERNSNKEFLYFLSIAKGSAGEVRSLLYIALDEKYISQKCFDESFNLVETTNRLIGGLIRYLRSSDYKGARHKP